MLPKRTSKRSVRALIEKRVRRAWTHLKKRAKAAGPHPPHCIVPLTKYVKMRAVTQDDVIDACYDIFFDVKNGHRAGFLPSAPLGVKLVWLGD